MNINQKKIKQLIRESIRRNLYLEANDQMSVMGRADVTGYALRPGDDGYDQFAHAYSVFHQPVSGSKRFEDMFDVATNTALTLAKLNPAFAAALDAKDLAINTFKIIHSFYHDKAEIENEKEFDAGVAGVLGVFLGMGFGTAISGPIVKGYIKDVAVDAVKKAIAEGIGTAVEFFINNVAGAFTGKVVDEVEKAARNTFKKSKPKNDKVFQKLVKAVNVGFKAKDIVDKKLTKIKKKKSKGSKVGPSKAKLSRMAPAGE